MPNISNRARIDQMFQVTTLCWMTISATIGAENREIGANWVQLIRAKDGNPSGRDYDPSTRRCSSACCPGITHAVKPGWRPFPTPSAGAKSEDLRPGAAADPQHWAHNKPFTDDDAYHAPSTQANVSWRSSTPRRRRESASCASPCAV